MSALQEFLNRRLFDVAADDERLRRLEKASVDLAKSIKRPELIPYTLVALDPDVAADEPHIEATMRMLTKHWNSVRDHFGDRPVVVLRAVIAEALRRAGKSNPTDAAIIWYTAANLAPHVVPGPETEIWTDLLSEVGGKTEREAMSLWDGGRDASMELPEELKIPAFGLRAAKIDTVRLTKHLTAAAGSSGGDVGDVTRNSNDPCYHSGQAAWVHSFGAIAGPAIAHAITDGLVKAGGSLEGTPEFQAAITAYIKQIGKAVQGAIRPIWSTALRTELLWWKESGYSPGLRHGYRQLEPRVRAFVMAADIHRAVPALSPQSVDFFLSDAVRQQTGEESFTVREYIESLAEATDAVVALLPKGKETSGRTSLLQYIRESLAGGGAGGETLQRLGLQEDQRLPLPTFSVWMYRDLQAYRLASQK